MPRVQLTSVVLSALLAPLWLHASATAKPEDGYLSRTHYLSRYFGLSLAFPAELNLVPAPVSQIQGRTRWLLGVQTTTGNAADLVITAAPPAKKDALSSLRSDFDDLADKPKPLTIGGQSFWKATAPRVADPHLPQIVEYAAIVRGYELKVRIATVSGAAPPALIDAVETASFLAPEAVPAARAGDMIEFAGPALPEVGKPTAAIARLDPGITDGDHYRNDSLGLDFTVPAGLKAHANTAPETELESGRPASTDKDYAAVLARQVTQTCSRPLLFADDGTHPTDGHMSPTVMLMAVDRLCLGGVRFPTVATDTAAVKLAARMLAERIRTGRADSAMKGRFYSLTGHLMLNLSGVLYGTESGTGLRVPNRVRLIATELDAYWVIWTFIAPDIVTLDRLSTISVNFSPGVTELRTTH